MNSSKPGWIALGLLFGYTLGKAKFSWIYHAGYSLLIIGSFFLGHYWPEILGFIKAQL